MFASDGVAMPAARSTPRSLTTVLAFAAPVTSPLRLIAPAASTQLMTPEVFAVRKYPVFAPGAVAGSVSVRFDVFAPARRVTVFDGSLPFLARIIFVTQSGL